jgi:large-conductance mechanosensitive channel
MILNIILIFIIIGFQIFLNIEIFIHLTRQQLSKRQSYQLNNRVSSDEK